MPWAELSDSRCYYELLGQGDPLLLVPGLGATCRVWDPIAPELSEHFTLILVDNRGIGRSVARRKPRTLADYSADLVELLDEWQLDRAHVLGLSLGGIIAQRFAVDHPNRVDRLILASCTDRFTTYLRRMAMLLGQSLRHFRRRDFAQTIDLLGTAPFHLDENTEELDRRLDEKCRNPVPARAMATQMRCLLCSEIDEDQYRITAPTLVIAGEHDALIPNCYAKRMADKIPGSRFVLLRGAGHNPLAETPGRVLPLIVNFLNERRHGRHDPAGGRFEGSAPPNGAGFADLEVGEGSDSLHDASRAPR